MILLQEIPMATLVALNHLKMGLGMQGETLKVRENKFGKKSEDKE